MLNLAKMKGDLLYLLEMCQGLVSGTIDEELASRANGTCQIAFLKLQIFCDCTFQHKSPAKN